MILFRVHKSGMLFFSDDTHGYLTYTINRNNTIIEVLRVYVFT